jgi:hypothetical protein
VTIINYIQAMQFAQAFLGLHATALQGVELVQRFQHHRSICGLGSDPGLGSDKLHSLPDSLNMSGDTLGFLCQSDSENPFLFPLFMQV